MSFLKTAKILTYLGILPFVAFSALAYTNHLSIAYFYYYLAVILSFLGGINWGLALKAENILVLLWSVLPAIFAWAFLALGHQVIVLAMFLLLYLQQYVFDYHLNKAKIISAEFLKLRLHATLAVALSLLLQIYKELG